jgi:hypothetical protein
MGTEREQIRDHELEFLHDINPGSEYKWGHHIERLKQAILEAEKVLVRVAAKRDLIAYSELCEQIQSAEFGPHDHVFHKVLDEVSVRGKRQGKRQGKGLLSGLVVYKDRNNQRPGPGFFDLARWLGHELPNREAEDAFWLQELQRIYAANNRFRRARGG